MLNTSIPKNKEKSAIASVHASWRKFPLSRDKSDTLLLLAACLLVLVPHFEALPWWAIASCAVLLTWRAWLTLTGRSLPRAWLLVPISVVMMAGVFLTFRTFFGREAGVTMLAILLTCKLLEMHAKRDLFVVIYLSFFVLLTSFFDSQTIASAALALLATVTLLTAQLSFQYTGVVPSLWQRSKLGLLILTLAIPLTLLSFFLFPRIQGPLWGLPGDAHSGRSGFSDSMAPGNISNLAQSEEIAFRVQFSGSAPDKSLLYWRGIVLNRFDGKTWSHEDAQRMASGKPIYQIDGKPVRQHIILEPNGQRWLFALDIPALIPTVEGMTNSINTQLEINSSQAINTRIRYDTVSYPNYQLQTALTPQSLQSSLFLPSGFNPKTLNYANELKLRIEDKSQRVQEVLQLFRRENFIYTLQPPLLGKNSVDEFLFGSRAGFCEHYSSAFVVLMRAMDIPSRVVTGYQGGALNSVDGYLEVRQSDAHAWAEVWLQNRGWIRIDPTAAVAPERVMQNLLSTQPRLGMSGLVNFTLGNNSWLLSMRMQWNAINNSWNLWVLNYNQTKQMDIMRSLGWAEWDWPQLALIFFLLALGVMALVALPLMYNRTQISALDRLYFSLCARLAKQGLIKAVHEGPFTLMQRLKGNLTDAQYETAHLFLSLYSANKYGKNTLPEATLVAQLKTLLAKYRQLNE
jgi:transglutaminase-like putative cysteine protease